MSKTIVSVRNTADQVTNRCLEVREFANDLFRQIHDMETTNSHIEVEPAIFDIGVIKTAHLNWKINLEEVLEGRRFMLADEVTGHHDCALGKWYDSA